MKSHLTLLSALAVLALPAAAQQLPEPVPAAPPAAAPSQATTPETTPPASPPAPAQPAAPAQEQAPAQTQGAAQGGQSATGQSATGQSATGQSQAQSQAAVPTHNEPCYTIVPPPQGVGLGPDGSVMLDRCTGKTWLLIRIAIPNDQGEMTGDFTYRWAPILYGDREALLSSPPPAPKPGAAPAPAPTKKRTK